jgi:uncharacterized protein YuzE
MTTILVTISSGNMRIKVDRESDALYFRLDENRIVESEEVHPGVILDFDENDQVVRVEFLGIAARATKEELSSLQFQTV